MDSVVTTKGQVVIPVDLREKYAIQKGTKVHFAEENGRIYLVPLNDKLIDKYYGILKSDSSKGSVTKALLEERRKEKQREDRKIKRWLRH